MSKKMISLEISDELREALRVSKEVTKVCEYYEKYAPEIFDLTMSLKDKIKEVKSIATK